MFMLDSLIRDIRIIISSIIIKYDKDAKVMETMDIIRDADTYITAYFSQDTFNSYTKFDLDIILSYATTNVVEAQLWHDNKKLIPTKFRDTLLVRQRNRIIESYVERNNYYRTLNGLPDIDDNAWIYADYNACIEVNIDPSIPIHLYGPRDIYTLMYLGEVDRLILKHPTKKYLKFLGLNKIDIALARTAKNFAILKMTTSINESLYKQFIDIYMQSRDYFMSVIYIKEYAKTYELYDNFMAMMIMVMTIQRVAINLFKNGIKRDFYDLDLIKMVFDVYGMPIILNLPLEYQRALMQNLNNLLRYKSTDKVLYDICSILGFERMKLFKYYLVKEHIMDINDNPIFLYTNVDDGMGGTISIEDKESMYNFYFQRVELTEQNIPLALTDNIMKVDYGTVIDNDPYWWDDEDLKAKLLEEDFNYIESKYVSMTLMYKLSQMLFEIIYIFRLILDKKDSTNDINVEIPKIFVGKTVNLFDTVVLLCALLAKKSNMAGNILITPSKILSIYGFNFSADFSLIQEDIRNNPDIYDQELLSYFDNMNIVSPKDVNDLFANIRGLNDFLIDKISTSTDIKKYRAYKTLFTTLMVSTESTALFTKPDGTIATTFKDYFKDYDITIYNFIDKADTDDIPSHIDHIIFHLNELLTNLKFINFLNDTNNPTITAITTLINFFKSYTVNLAPMNIFYIMDSRVYNFITLIGDINSIKSTISTNEFAHLIDHININKSLSIMNNIKPSDKLNEVTATMIDKTGLEFIANISNITGSINTNSRTHLIDQIASNKSLFSSTNSVQYDKLNELLSCILDKTNLNFSHSINSIEISIIRNSIIYILDSIDATKIMSTNDRRTQYDLLKNLLSSICDKSNLNITDRCGPIDTTSSIVDKSMMLCFILGAKTFDIKDLYKFHDTLKFMSTTLNKSTLELKDYILTSLSDIHINENKSLIMDHILSDKVITLRDKISITDSIESMYEA